VRRVRDKFLILGVAVGLALTATLVVTRGGPSAHRLARRPRSTKAVVRSSIPRAAADLSRRASTALAASIHGPQHDEVVRLLRLETNPQQLESALEALSRDTNFGAAKSSLAAVGGASRARDAPAN
jgi:hypothetical protein